MFQQLAADQSSNFEEECPDLVDDMLGSVALLSERNEQSRMNVDGIADFGGTNAMLLWDSLEAVAHDDDSKTYYLFHLIPKVKFLQIFL